MISSPFKAPRRRGKMLKDRMYLTLPFRSIQSLLEALERTLAIQPR